MLPLRFNARAGSPLKLLCLGAHSDDIEIGCGGTLLRLLSEHPGCEVHWVVMSANPPRALEARASADAFLDTAGRKTVIVKDFKESFFPYVGAEIKIFFEELKGMVKPDVIFSHRLHDRHQDHRIIAEFTWNTFRDHLILEYEIAKYEGDLGQPNIFVPLARAVAERKVELLIKHFASQATRTWFRPATFQGLMSIRGVECNADEGYAEAFHASKLVI
jgi:LmbE family N-acetylglucosaminyl deacetylase